MTGSQVKERESAAGALRGLELFAEYDALRLATYRDGERLGERIRMKSFGNATALRFDDVGYFNRIYSPNDDVLGRLDEVEEFFEGSAHGCELICAPEAEGPAGRERWTPGKSYAWLYAKPVPEAASEFAAEYEIRRPRPEERTAFLETYLRAFEAEEAKIPEAVRNMRHLFELTQLDFLIAMEDAQFAAIGMLYRSGRSAVLCAGAALPGRRRQGYHAALLSARLRLAAEAGCEEVVSWADAGGRSQINMERAGLATAGVTRAWKLHPHVRR